jgi:hypothetical protein
VFRPRWEDILPTLVAHVEFRLDADRLEEGGGRLLELAQAASGVGFELKRGRIEPVPADEVSRLLLKKPPDDRHVVRVLIERNAGADGIQTAQRRSRH